MSDLDAGGSLIWGEYRSPEEVSLAELWNLPLPGPRDFRAIGRDLADGISGRRIAFVDSLQAETGFLRADCEELVMGAIAYAQGFAAHPSTQIVDSVAPEFIGGGRRMGLVGVPYGTVAAILPHNAFLPLGLACLLNALRAGNRVVLRSPTQSTRSAALLSEVIVGIPEVAPWVSILLCSARPFVDAFMASPGSGLLQFFGSSRRAAELVARGFDAGKTVLVDGEGNSWVYVDASYSAEAAAELLVQGATRYHGQTCTSINGAIVHPDLFAEVSGLVVSRIRDIQPGALFDEDQAEWCLGRVTSSGGQIVVGGSREGSVLSPSVVLHPSWESELVREGLFGPAIWLASGDSDIFAARWSSNRFPLCAAVLQSPADPTYWAARLPGLARLVFNGDPSVEDPFEYWGGYPPSAQNPVSAWPAKYRRVVQVDLPR